MSAYTQPIALVAITHASVGTRNGVGITSPAYCHGGARMTGVGANYTPLLRPVVEFFLMRVIIL